MLVLLSIDLVRYRDNNNNNNNNDDNDDNNFKL